MELNILLPYTKKKKLYPHTLLWRSYTGRYYPPISALFTKVSSFLYVPQLNFYMHLFSLTPVLYEAKVTLQ
jgi:hypothetical protein